MPTPIEASDAELRRQLATLTFSEVGPSGSSQEIQAVAWWNMLARLGLRPPLVAVHDLGMLLAQGREGRHQRLSTAPLAPSSALRAQYRALLGSIAAGELVQTLGATAPRDETIAVVLARVLSDVYLRWPGAPRSTTTRELPLASAAYGRDRAVLAKAADPGWAVPFLQRFVEHDRAVLARLDQIDVSALRLLGLFAVDGGLPDLVDLYQVMGAIGTADIVDFSLQLLPSLLETKRRRSVQRFSIDGYASIENRGQLDALLPGELAHDDETFAVRTLSDELLYYGRERAPEAGRRLNYVLVDASASMRGAREVFARGLALALAKKLGLLGGDVWLRFFDSRLHPRLDLGRGARRDLPRLLSFRSERGRNYARVFGDLSVEIARLVRDEGRDVTLTFITHGACQIPLPTVETLAAQAQLCGIFVLPSRPLDLDYLPRLHRVQVVTASSLARSADKRRRALQIIDEAASG